MAWQQPYKTATEREQLSPAYVLFIADSEATTTDPITATDTAFSTPNIFPYTTLDGEPLLAYDRNGFELMIGDNWTEDFTGSRDRYELVTRGQFGTIARSFLDNFRVMVPKMAFSTHTISDSTFPFHASMGMPSGFQTKLMYQEGRTSVSGVTIEVGDTDNWITRKLENFTVHGKRAVILGGYQGMDFKHFEILYVGKVSDMSYEAGVYAFEITNDFDKMNVTLYGFIEDTPDSTGKMVLSGGHDASTTTITVDDATNANTLSAPAQLFSDGGRAAMYLRLSTGAGAENVRVTSRTGSDFTVVRAQLNTSAASHADNAEVDYFFSIDTNPINALLALLLSRKTPGHAAQHTTYDLGAALGAGAAGVGWHVADLDVEEFERIRDDWFPNVRTRFDFVKRTSMRSYIERYIKKPLGLNLYIDRTGRLSLAVLRPPTPLENFKTLTKDDIVDAPKLDFAADEILNNVTLKYDYDAFADSFASKTIVLDSTSQVDLGKEGAMTIEARGIRTEHAGVKLAKRYPNKHIKNFGQVNPRSSIRVLFNKGAEIEPGSAIQMNHADLPDVDTGKKGFDHFVRVVGKRINWRDGTIDLDILTTVYGKGKAGLIAPAGTADFTSAAQDVKDRYVFASNASSKMSDNTGGYIIA